MATATGGFLDLAAADLFGGGLPRQAGEANDAFRARIGRALKTGWVRWTLVAGAACLVLAVTLAASEERVLLDAVIGELSKGGRLDPLAADLGKRGR